MFHSTGLLLHPQVPGHSYSSGMREENKALGTLGDRELGRLEAGDLLGTFLSWPICPDILLHMS